MDTLRVGVQLTESCNAACAHCCTTSSPKSKNTFEWKKLKDVLDSIHEMRQDALVCFTGGEVFYERDLLFQAIEYVRKLGLRYSLTTNGYWGENLEEREEILNQVIDCTAIGFSSDVYHDVFISRQTVRATLDSALDKGIYSIIRYTLRADENELDVRQSFGLDKPESQENIRFNRLMALGRGVKLEEKFFPEYERGQPCMAASVPTIRANGDVLACCGESFYLDKPNPLNLGTFGTQSIKEILALRDSNLSLKAVRTVGPIEFLEMTEDKKIPMMDHDLVLRKSPCGACKLLFGSVERINSTNEAAEKYRNKINTLSALYYGEV